MYTKIFKILEKTTFDLNYKRLIYILSVIFFLIALTCRPGFARIVEIKWIDNKKPFIDSELKYVFKRAVFEEALDIIPGELTAERKNLLYNHFEQIAGIYVFSYSDRQLVEMDNESTLTLNVNVNRSELKEELKRIGIYYTTVTPWTFDIHFTGGSGSAWNMLGKFMNLSGIVTQAGVEPVVKLQYSKKDKLWLGSLEVKGQKFTAAGKRLKEVWFELCGQFFTLSDIEVKAGLVDWVVVDARGWYVPDGVMEFGQELNSWQGLVEDTTLLEMDILATGINATWRIKVANRTNFINKLSQYVRSRQIKCVVDGKLLR